VVSEDETGHFLCSVLPPLPFPTLQLTASEQWERHVLSASVSVRTVCDRAVTSAFAFYPLNYLTHTGESV